MSYITLSVVGLVTMAPEILDADHLILPEGVNRETLQTLILTETAELEVMYPEPVTMAAVVKAWSTARKPSWERMLAALSEEYNPLHNYDRHEVEEHTDTDADTDGGTVTHKRTGTEATAKTGTEAFSGESTNQGTSTGSVAGYNANTLADADKTVNSGSGQDSGTTTHNTTDTTTHNTTDTETRNLTRERTNEGGRNLHAYGNIGVTTSAQMLAGELEVRQTDIYRIITTEFIRYFCLLVY